MSNKALTWAFESGLPSGARFVLVALADAGSDHSGEDWTCFPSVNKIMDMTGQGRSTVERHLSWLWAEGWISRKARVRPDGTLGINDFTLHRRAETRADLKADRAVQERRPGRRPSLKSRDGETPKSRVSIPQIDDQQTLNLRGHEPSSDPLIDPSTRAREPGDDGFDEIYALWPKRGQKFTKVPAARAAWAKARELESHERLRQAVLNCATDPDRVKGDFGWPGLDRFLCDETWRGYLPEGGSGPVGGTNPRFEGPAEIRDAVIAAAPAAEVEIIRGCIDRAAWDAGRGLVIPATTWAFGKLRAPDVAAAIRHQGADLAAPGTPIGGSHERSIRTV